MARNTKATCDICNKEFDQYKIYFTAGVCSDGGIVVNPIPSKVEVCSVECLVTWINKLKVEYEAKKENE